MENFRRRMRPSGAIFADWSVHTAGPVAGPELLPRPGIVDPADCVSELGSVFVVVVFTVRHDSRDDAPVHCDNLESEDVG